MYLSQNLCANRRDIFISMSSSIFFIPLALPWFLGYFWCCFAGIGDRYSVELLFCLLLSSLLLLWPFGQPICFRILHSVQVSLSTLFCTRNDWIVYWCVVLCQRFVGICCIVFFLVITSSKLPESLKVYILWLDISRFLSVSYCRTSSIPRCIPSFSHLWLITFIPTAFVMITEPSVSCSGKNSSRMSSTAYRTTVHWAICKDCRRFISDFISYLVDITGLSICLLIPLRTVWFNLESFGGWVSIVKA